MNFSWIAQLVKNPPAMQEAPGFDSWVGKIHWRRDRVPAPVFLGFPCGSAGKKKKNKNPPAMRKTAFDPWVGKIPWRRERLPTSVFWPGEFHGLYKSDTTEQLPLSLFPSKNF